MYNDVGKNISPSLALLEKEREREVYYFGRQLNLFSKLRTVRNIEPV